jgi:N-acetylneuraminate synthase
MPEQYGLNVIQELKERYKVPIGFSDHSAQKHVAATALGASILNPCCFDRQLLVRMQSIIDHSGSKRISFSRQNIAAALSNPIDKTATLIF